MKAIKFLLFGFAGLVVLALIGIGAALMIVDGQFVKTRLEQAMKERNRTLAIEGQPTLKLFPVFRMSIGKTTLSEANSDKAFVSLESMEFAVKVMPLLSGEIAVDVLALSGLRVNIVRARDGSLNIDDLQGRREEVPAKVAVPPRFRIAEVKIERAQIAYSDLASGQSLVIGDLNLRTGRLEDDTPTPLSLSASVAGTRPEFALKTQLQSQARMNLASQSFAFAKLDAMLSGNAATIKDLDLRLTGDVAADLRRQEYNVNALNLQAKGMLERDALVAALSAPRLHITSSKAEGQKVSGTLSVRGPQRSVDARLSVAAVEGSASALTVPSLVMDFDGSVAGSALKGQIATPVKANLKEGVWELAKVAASLSLGRADTALKAQLTGAAMISPASRRIAVSGLDATATGSHDVLKGLDVHVSGNLAADVGKQEYTADKVSLRAKGTIDRDAFDAAFQAPKLHITPAKAEGQAVTGTVIVKGPQREIDAKLNIAAVEGSASALSIPNLSLDVVSNLAGSALKGQIATPVKANLKEGVWELAKVVASFSLGRANTALKAQLTGAAMISPAMQKIAVSGLDATATGSHDVLKGLDLHVSGNLAADVSKQEYTADKVSLRAKGTIDRDAFDAAFQAPKLHITPAKAEGQAVTGTVIVKGPQREIDAKLNIAAVEGSANSLSIPALRLELASNLSGNGIKGTISTPVQANLGARTWELPKVVANLTVSGPAIPQKTVTLPIQAALRADLAKQSARGELTTKFDETNINAKFGATRFEPLVATFDVGIDKLDLDRYLPPEQKGAAKTDERVDLSALHGKTVSGKFAAGALTVKRVKLQNVKADIKLAGGRLEVAPHSASLYGGTLAGSLTADANGNRVTIKDNLQNVALGPLLRDAAQKDVMEGRGNVSVDVSAAGATVGALKKALAGSAKVDIKDGSVKGINLADTARNAKSMIGMKQQKPDATQKTDFSEMSASFRIANGVARNDDLKAASPFLRLVGAGNLDIGNNGIDYLAKATLAATAKGQGGRDAKDVAGVTIPVKLTGALDNPSWNVDYSALAGNVAKSGITEAIKKKGAGGAAGSIGEGVRGLFKR